MVNGYESPLSADLYSTKSTRFQQGGQDEVQFLPTADGLIYKVGNIPTDEIGSIKWPSLTKG